MGIREKERIREISSLAGLLPEAEQKALLRELRLKVLLAEAAIIDAGIKPNRIAMKDIITETRGVRGARYAARRKKRNI